MRTVLLVWGGGMKVAGQQQVRAQSDGVGTASDTVHVLTGCHYDESNWMNWRRHWQRNARTGTGSEQRRKRGKLSDVRVE